MRPAGKMGQSRAVNGYVRVELMEKAYQVLPTWQAFVLSC